MSNKAGDLKRTVPGSNSRRPAPRRGAAGGRRGRGKQQGRRARDVALVILAVAGLAVIFFVNNRDKGAASAGDYRFQVGDPGPGSRAPLIRLPSTEGAMFDLASLRGQKVLLYFQEGLMCQPCWDQIVDIEKQMSKLSAVGVDRMVSITTDPLEALRIKVADEGISTPVLSDPGLGVSKAYKTNLYGMMGNSMNGHSFILVDEQGVIQWRADYGGEPDNTMYVPPANLFADLAAGIAPSQS